MPRSQNSEEVSAPTTVRIDGGCTGLYVKSEGGAFDISIPGVNAEEGSDGVTIADGGDSEFIAPAGGPPISEFTVTPAGDSATVSWTVSIG